MHEEPVVLAGASGELGGRIATELSRRRARVRGLVRPSLGHDKHAALKALGIDIAPVDFGDRRALAGACAGASIVVSALAGLRDVVVDTQTRLLETAVDAGVPRFMPSDFAIDTGVLRLVGAR